MTKTKQEFFNKLNQKLAKKYKIHPYAVKIMRSNIIGMAVSPKKVVDKMTLLISRRSARVKIYQNVIGFLKNANIEEIGDLLQKTKFDN